MTTQDFQKVLYFTQAEVEKTGANIADVKTDLLMRLDIFRKVRSQPVVLLHNGLTSGVHKSQSHPNGLAADVTIPKELDFVGVFKDSLEAGFKEIGLYWTGIRYNYHLAISTDYKFWTAILVRGQWQYHDLLVDPRDLRPVIV